MHYEMGMAKIKATSLHVSNRCCNDEEVSGKGIFMHELINRLEEEHLNIPMVGVKGSDGAAEQIRLLL